MVVIFIVKIFSKLEIIFYNAKHDQEIKGEGIISTNLPGVLKLFRK